MRKVNSHILLHYVLALAAVGAGWLIDREMLEWPRLDMFPAMLVAVMVGAWKGGLGPGLLAAVLAGSIAPWIAGNYGQASGSSAAHFLAEDVARVAVYLMAGGVIGLLSSSRERGALSLRANQELFHRFIDAIPVAAYVKDENGHYLYINRRMQRLFKASSANCAGKTDFDIFPRDLAQRFRSEDALVLSTGRELSVEQTIVQDETPQHWLIHKFRFQGASGQHFLAGILVNIAQSRGQPVEAKAMINPLDVGQLQSALERTLSKVDLPAAAESAEEPRASSETP